MVRGINPPKYDEIGYWSEIKLEIISKYATAYSRIMTANPIIQSHLYIDAFAGFGKHVSKQSGKIVPGSPLKALSVSPSFREFHFIDLDGGKASELRQITRDRSDVTVHEGDCNEILLEKVFPCCVFKDYRRALCLLDPYNINVDWTVLKKAGDMRSVDIFYNFMIMDANMNIFWRNPDKVPADQMARMDRSWGDRSWRNVAYRKERGLFGAMEEKEDNQAVAEAFRKRLVEVAGFKYVPEPLPMKNSRGAVIYYLFFASPNRTGSKIVEDIFNKYRQIGVK